MPISNASLYFANPSPQARRLWWHVLSIGKVWRDEVERHAGADKAGVHLFWVERGKGTLELPHERHELRPGPCCWLVDLRQPRSYLPPRGVRLATAGFRFHGPGLEAWTEALGRAREFRFTKKRDFDTLRCVQRRLLALVMRRPTGYEWHIHEGITQALGWLLRVRGVLQAPKAEVPEPVERVLKAVFADAARDWRVTELVAIAGTSYSRLRTMFRASQEETIHEFLQRTRLDLARQLLCDHRLSVKEIAARLNFSSEFYFSHFFRHAAGCSPSRFRRDLQA